MNPGGDKLLCEVHAPLYVLGGIPEELGHKPQISVAQCSKSPGQELTPTIPADTSVADEERKNVLGE
ncbi:MAG TPA: hypothetical protein VF503_21485 [Sphingobium sp.]|uniref:hypothetical protein n=1 Tax=Sphingobium sp. TaxID=1912891 RepID=UPI002ED67BA9